MNTETLAVDLTIGQQIIVPSPSMALAKSDTNAREIKTISDVLSDGGWTTLKFTDGTAWTPRDTREIEVIA